METQSGVVASSWVHLELEQLFSTALPGIPTFPSRLTFTFVYGGSLVRDVNNTWGSSGRNVLRWHIWTFAASLIQSTPINFDLYCAKSQPKASQSALHNQKKSNWVPSAARCYGDQEKICCEKKPRADPGSRGPLSAFTSSLIERYSQFWVIKFKITMKQQIA